MKYFIFFFVLTAVIPNVLADTIYLKNGSKIEAQGTWEEGENIGCFVQGKIQKYHKDKVLKIEEGDIVEINFKKRPFEYNIIKDESKHNIKRTIVVVLNRKVSRSVLKEIGLILKNSETRSYQRTFISYLIAGTDVHNDGYWATTHFNPNLEVKFYSLSVEEEKLLTKKTEPRLNRKIIGSWLDDWIGSKKTIFLKDGKLFLESIYPDGSAGVCEMTERKVNGRRIIEDKGGNSFGEFFLINSNNELEFWGPKGNYYTAKSIH